MEELNIRDELTEEECGVGPASREVAGTDQFLRSLIADVEGLAEGLAREDAVQRQLQEEETEEMAFSQEVFLQTKTYSLAEVKQELEEWKASMESEFHSITEETGAIRVITEAEAEQLRRDAERQNVLFERIPAKAVFTRKAGTGKRKCRACACGNFMTQRSLADTYAGGTGATEVRAILRRCGLRSCSAVTLDVKTAFLRARKDHSKEIVIVQPPQVFILAGVCQPGTLWLVDRALYGLITSPKEWTQFRNQRMVTFKWSVNGIDYAVEKTEDPDIWKIVKPAWRCTDPGGEGTWTAVAEAPLHRCTDSGGEGTWAASSGGSLEGHGSLNEERPQSAAMTDVGKVQNEVVGYFVTYVDDVLAVGEEGVLDGFCTRMQQEWEVGSPDWLRKDGPPVRFLGMEIELRKGVYRVHQQSYIQSLLEKYPEEKGLRLSHIKTPEEEDHVTPQEVQVAQRQTGELLWLAGRTRPDISFAVSLMSMYATKRPKGVMKIGREVRAYLKTSLDLALEYGRLPDGDFGEGGSQRRARHENLIEVYTDASYASSGLKSISGVVGFYAGAPVFWITCRQSFVTLSTAEAELMSMLEGLTALRCVKSVVSMLQSGPLEGRMYSDSTAGISIVSGTTGSWRTRHLKIRAQGLHEAVDRGETTLEHQSGKLLVADGMTKQLQGMLLRHFIQALKMTTEKREVVAVKRLCEGGDQRKRLQDALALLVVSTSIVMASAEGTEIEPTATNEDSMSWIFLMVAVAVILVVVDMVSRFGIDTLRRWISREEPGLLMHELASVPTRGTEGSAGLDLTTVEEYRIPSGEYMLVRTGIAVELPHGTYGRMVRGIEVGGGVIDRDFRGEIKVLIHNLSPMEFWIRSGDRVAQLIVEKAMEVRVEQVDALSTTTRVLTGPEWTNSRDAGQGITSFSVRRLGEVRQLEQSQDGGSSSQEPAPAAPQPVGTTAHEGGRDTLTEPTSLSQTSTLQSPLTMTPPTFMPREMIQPSSTSQESSIATDKYLEHHLEKNLKTVTAGMF